MDCNIVTKASRSILGCMRARLHLDLPNPVQPDFPVPMEKKNPTQHYQEWSIRPVFLNTCAPLAWPSDQLVSFRFVGWPAPLSIGQPPWRELLSRKR